MNQKEIKELIEFLVQMDIAEFSLERGDVKLHIKRAGVAQPAAVAPVVVAVPQAAAGAATPATTPASGAPAATSAASPAAPAAAPAASEDAGLSVVKSPIVGTFYEAPSPGAPPFVRVGDTVKEGQVLCIIEAMKLMNEIEADASGVIAKIFVPNGSPVEYGMPLFGIRKQ